MAAIEGVDEIGVANNREPSLADGATYGCGLAVRKANQYLMKNVFRYNIGHEIECS